MSDSTHHAILKLIALLVGLDGLIVLFGGLSGGAFAKLIAIVLGILLLVTAAGFWRMQGWAFLLVSVLLLVGAMKHMIGFVVSFDKGGVGGAAFWLVANLLLIAYLGRWSIEKRFRPHLDDHH